VALIGAVSAIIVVLLPILLSREPSPNVAPPATVEPSAKVEPSATVELSPTVEPSATVEPSPTVEVVQVDTMDSLVGWAEYTDDLGSTLEVSSKPGRTDSAVELFFNLQEGGWVGVAKAVSPGSLAGSDGLSFYLRGSGEPNTIEFKLLYTLEDGTNPVFSMNWYAKSVTGDWVYLEAYYDQFTCWEETGCDPGSVPDPTRVTRIDIAVSNKPGDVPGIGVVLLDSIETIYR
jgi:hypothetical protein